MLVVQKVPRLSVSAVSDDDLMPMEMGAEVKRVVLDCMSVVGGEGEYKVIPQFQRVDFFRALVTYLHRHVPICEKAVINMTVHSLAQAMVVWKQAGGQDDQLVGMQLEASEGSSKHVTYKIPGWLLRGMATYFLEVRCHFVPKEGPVQYTRRFERNKEPIKTEALWYNSGSSRDFRVATVSRQFTKAVRWHFQFIPLHDSWRAKMSLEYF